LPDEVRGRAAGNCSRSWATLTVSAAILAASALVILLAPEIRRPGRHAAGGASAGAGVSVSGAERVAGAGTLPRSAVI